MKKPNNIKFIIGLLFLMVILVFGVMLADYGYLETELRKIAFSIFGAACIMAFIIYINDFEGG